MKKVRAYDEEWYYIGTRNGHAVLRSIDGRKDFVCPIKDIKGLEDED